MESLREKHYGEGKQWNKASVLTRVFLLFSFPFRFFS